tara:strand:- start:46 stop:399 length:354 start_codon:yes stop_codon:yes gene_type:complete
MEKIHLGKKLKQVLEERGMSHAEFARRINKSSQNVYSMFDRKEIGVSLLAEAGEVLNFDFFSLLGDEEKKPMMVAEPPQQYNRPEGVALQIVIDGTETTLKKQIELLRRFNKALATP